MVTRRGFLAKLGAVIAAGVVVRELPPPAPPSFHFLDHYAAALRREQALLEDLVPVRLDVLYGVRRIGPESIAVRVIA